jgi:membrane carboxypeptidase/penicillin-binding protein
MWIGFMHEALGGTAERVLPRPEGIVEYRINPTTGRILSQATPDSIFEKFDIDHLPEREHDSGLTPFEDLEQGVTTAPNNEQLEQQIFN